MFSESPCLSRFSFIQEEIKFLTNSEIRLKILRCLFFSPYSVKDIKDKTNLSYSSISGNINKLEQKGYIKNNNDKYFLTNIAKIKLANILYLNKSLNFIEDNSDFFNEHTVDNFEFDVLNDLSPLDGVELIESPPTDVYKATRIFKDFFIGSHSLKAIFPYLHPQNPIIFQDWLERDVGVKLIIPNDVSNALINIISHFKTDNQLKNRYLKIKSVDRAVHVALVISDKGIALSFYKKDGTFDQNHIMVSIEDKAIEWANEVFEEYEKLTGDYKSLENIIYKD